jgi:hypothetical protein
MTEPSPTGELQGAVAEVLDARDYVVAGSRIFTMELGAEVIDGYVHVRDGRVVATGEGSVPESLSSKPVLQAGATAVLPGFVDPHMHLEQASCSVYGSIDCHAEVTDSIDAIIEQLRANLDAGDAREGWVIGQGNLFMDRRLDERRYPNRDDLDKVSRTSPVVFRCGSHVSILNSVALERLLARSVEIRSDAAIEVDETGRPNGLVHELFHELGVPELTEAQLAEALTEGAERWLTSNGTTTCGEITDTMESLQTLVSLSRGGAIPQRIDAYPCVPWTAATIPEAAGIAHREDLRGPRFRMPALKLFVDGGYSAYGAAVLRPYRNVPEGADNRYGRLAYSEVELAELIRQTDEAGFQLVAHTNGERSQRAMCSAAATIDRGGLPPIRLEHAGNFISDFATVDHWRRAGAIPVAQAAFIWSMSSFLPDYLGDWARAGRMPFRSLLDRGVDLSFASDAAASDPRAFSPLFNMQCAITRISCTGEQLDPAESLDVMTALRMHTSAAARAMGLDREVGSLRPGAHADFLLLSDDPERVEPSRLSQIAVQHTFIAGRRIGPNSENPCRTSK